MEINNKGENFLGNVVRIISDLSLIIDVGEDFLTIGDKVQIYTVFDEIKDLDGNSLGPYENIKDTLNVVQTTANYSVCEKITTKRTSSYASLSNAFTTSEYTVKESLNVDKNEIQPLKKGNDNKQIHVGDYVKKYWVVITNIL